MEQSSVCLPEHHPGYLSCPENLQTGERLRSNVKPRSGVAAEEPSVGASAEALLTALALGAVRSSA